MAGPRIHVAATLVAAAEITLPEGASRHVAGALRLREGAALRLFDGEGHEAEAEIVSVGRREVRVRVTAVTESGAESPLAVHLGQAISKGDRMDYAIQKATELGVAAITPLYTEHGDVRLKGEREAKKLAHWQAVAVSACEQCGRSRVPTVHPPQTLDAWLATRDETLRLVLHPSTDTAWQHASDVTRVALLVGPEGGLSPNEVDAAHAADFTALTLGPRILRTETAPVVALTLLQHHFGDLG
ncbi:16S rRNA (uracil(1498)-N(3))-methyltransferase [Chromohalobacter beijerinckii]|uniref:Ribosomal RNA small subunit methyltransferase E n=3 Tax=Chromohalobacter TaxID=42054 RepID=A0A1Q8TFA9_9GAMM|nr:MULTISPECIES: 16S rRNA (uracil(1498)-N(3))-methyltransferase [Chromohalobacter]CDQ34325.1 Ribosomal RNA small subunit methyltransferase E [Virgibacillus halodenitrificans]MCK0766957.1 16S rRNA (uracil(1498)-N(3))-methyltransferase [Chromohalobacter beijerinckii]MCK2043310.1 16S rRNA (uracil(1498)-N(3))-methyltransferase [Chromohalobacter moromii]MCK2046029.1 16S rRNA (uracil(1498)-N(3))-methyltransferase [Chromohalobacter moromii]MCT8505547.1 16S rRNA (uracil(1498)-N(3))-methyltransferase [